MHPSAGAIGSTAAVCKSDHTLNLVCVDSTAAFTGHSKKGRGPAARHEREGSCQDRHKVCLFHRVLCWRVNPLLHSKLSGVMWLSGGVQREPTLQIDRQVACLGIMRENGDTEE